LSFRNSYNLEVGSTTAYDGGVLEIKIGAGAWTDILSAGGSFVSGGYNFTISSSYSNPLAGRQAWSGNSSGFITTVVQLPLAAAGQNIQLRWRCGTDNSVTGSGWSVDTVAVSTRACCAESRPRITLASSGYATNGLFQFNLSGTAGSSWIVQASTNLSNWVSLVTNIVPFAFFDTNNGSLPQRFYRARISP
jgi:hypothetical protein